MTNLTDIDPKSQLREFEFLSLPPEIRLMVYRYLFTNAAVKFARKLRDEYTRSVVQAPCAALLTCNKTIYYESRTLFYQLVRLDVSTIIDKDTGALRSQHRHFPDAKAYPLPIDRADIQHVKIAQELFRGEGTKDFIRSLPNLKSLIYTIDLTVFINDASISSPEDAQGPFCYSAWHRERRENFMELTADQFIGLSPLIIGKCWKGHTVEKPIGSVVAAWAWNCMPFRMVARVGIGSMFLHRKLLVSAALSTAFTFANGVLDWALRSQDQGDDVDRPNLQRSGICYRRILYPRF